MKKMRPVFYIWFVLLSLLFTLPARAQISEGGIPPSFGLKNILRGSVAPFVTPVNFDVEHLKAEDSKAEALGFPLNAVKIIPVDINMENSGMWTTLQDGSRMWQLTIQAPGAIATMLYYNEFYIPEGSKLFIYNSEKTQILGAYTSKTNIRGKEFATELVAGEELTLEYIQPVPDTEKARIQVSGIGYGYNHIKIYPVVTLRDFGNSNECQVNVNCSEGDDWQLQKRGVARTLTPTSAGTSAWCTGTIVNNTAEDLTPYFLSANHCFSSSTPQNLNQMILYFNYEFAECENQTTQPVHKTMVGAQMLVSLPIDGGSDGALLQLNQAIPESYNVYYNGWNHTSNAATSGVGIHHPKGDVKKIATFNRILTTATWNGADESGATGAHWQARFIKTDNGFSITEGGSSGSPIFNQYGLVVGTLTGNNSVTCQTASYNLSLYGKLWYHWDQAGSSPAKQMKTYLDPLSTGQDSLFGISQGNAVTANFIMDNASVYASQSVKFTNTSYHADTYEWYFEGGSPDHSTDVNPVVTYNNLGAFSARLVVNKGTNTQKEKVRTVTVTQKTETRYDTLSIHEGNQKSQFPLGMLDKQIISSSIYKAAELGSKPCSITSLAWYETSPLSLGRTFRIYMKEVTENEQTATTWSDDTKDAKLVYDNSTFTLWVNNEGWVNVSLTQPFEYSGTKNLKVIVRTVNNSGLGWASSDCYYSNVSNAHKQWISNSSSLPSEVGTVNSNRPDIRIISSFQAASVPVADFSMKSGSTTSVNGKITIYEGDSVQFSSLSSGPPVTWSWNLPGTVTQTSEEENPEGVYKVTGTYPVSLTVKSNLGTNTKNIQDAVTVIQRSPVPAFYAKGGDYTLYDNYGQLLPPSGALVTFVDTSTNNPQRWNWSFAGGNITSSEEKNPQVSYASKGNFDVSLKVSNTAGSPDPVTKPGFIKVGGNAEIWNMPFNDPGNATYGTNSGIYTYYVSGASVVSNTIAEKFRAPSAAGTISSVKIYFKNGTNNNVNLTIAIHKDNSGVPSDEALSTVTLDPANIKRSAYTEIKFPEPVPVSEAFYIVISGFQTNLTSSASTTGVYVFTSYDQGGGVTGTMMYKDKTTNTWHYPSYVYGAFSCSLSVVPLFAYNSGSGIGSVDLQDMQAIYPNPVYNDLHIKSNNGIVNVQVSDLSGRKIYMSNYSNETEVTIHAASWNKGTYLVTITTTNGTKTHKIIKN